MRSILLILLDRFVCFFSSPDRSLEVPLKRKVVFLRLDAIGDFVLWSSFLDEWDRLYPKKKYHRTLVGNVLWTDLAKEFNFFDDVIGIDRRRFSSFSALGYRIKTLRTMRRLRCEVLLHPTFSRDLLVSESIAYAIPANEKVAPQGDFINLLPGERFLNRGLYNRLLPNFPNKSNKPRMELLEEGWFLQALSGNPVSIQRPTFSKIKTSPVNSLENKQYFVVSPGAGESKRQWEFTKFIEVARVLQRDHGWICVFCGSNADKQLFSKQAPVSDLQFVNLMGETSLVELISIVKKSKLVLTNETGTAHLAAACSVPTICITGGGHFGRFVPWKVEELEECSNPMIIAETMPCFNCNWTCHYKVEKNLPFPCISKISTEAVLQKIQNLPIESIHLGR